MSENKYNVFQKEDDEAVKKITTLKAELKDMREALEPFTHPDLCKNLAGNVRGDKSPVFGRNNATLYLGDFRKARKALGRRDE